MLKNAENIADLPKIVPIFPLSEVILLPKGQIKLKNTILHSNGDKSRRIQI